MAILIQCADCGAQISSDVTKCPQCEGNPWPTVCRFCLQQDRSTAIPQGFHDTCRDAYRSQPGVEQFSCPTCKTALLYEDVTSPQDHQYELRWGCRICGQPMLFTSCAFCGALVLAGKMHPICKEPYERWLAHSKAMTRAAKRKVWQAEGLCPECGSSFVRQEERFFRGTLSRCETCGYAWS
jgi:hypothetical protein